MMNIKRNRVEFIKLGVLFVLLAVVLVFSAVNTIKISQESDYYHGTN